MDIGGFSLWAAPVHEAGISQGEIFDHERGKGTALGRMARLAGIEPAHPAPEAGALSTEL